MKNTTMQYFVFSKNGLPYFLLLHVTKKSIGKCKIIQVKQFVFSKQRNVQGWTRQIQAVNAGISCGDKRACNFDKLQTRVQHKPQHRFLFSTSYKLQNMWQRYRSSSSWQRYRSSSSWQRYRSSSSTYKLQRSYQKVCIVDDKEMCMKIQFNVNFKTKV